MPRPMINVTLDFTDIETRIAKGERVTVKHIADENNVSPTVVRRAIEAHYANRVVFKKGRTGGINLKAKETSTKETETAMAT
jgi:predicted transcriptional regulator